MEIFSDSIIEFNWFKNLNHAFKDTLFQEIKGRGKNSKLVEQVIKYDRPDIILIKDNKILLVIEKTQEVPTGHNVGQRMARLVRSIELGVPTIYFCPFKARKHGKYTSICNINGRLFDAFFKIWTVHNTPLYLVNWKCDENGELISDGSEDKEIKKLVNMYIDTNFKGNIDYINNEKRKLLISYKEAVSSFEKYSSPPDSVSLIQTSSFLDEFNKNLNNHEKNKINTKEKTVLYKIGMKQGKSAKRQDPFTGTQFIYDYLYCRDGVRVENKKNNLILYFPFLSKSFWELTNPNNNTKSSNWYITANGLLFNDGYIFIR